MSKLLVILVLLSVYLLSPAQIYAGDFSTISVRLDSHQSSTTTGGLICATPDTAGVESKVQIEWPAGFIVNTSTANWTVSTTDLPAGSSPWIGIGTANSISGQNVTFPSGDLSTGVNYCFHFSSTNTLTTASNGDNQFGTITTQTSGNSPIDQRQYGLSLVSNDRVGVTASVNANSSDFESEITLLNPGIIDPIAGDVVLNYQVEYSSSLNYPVTLTVQADWSLGTIENDSLPTVEMLDYVSNSASLGYGDAVPQIDLVNRRISWQITAFPADSTETVTFSLKTDGSYYDSRNISFSVYSRVLGPGVITTDQEVTNLFYNPPVEGPDSGSSASPTPNPSSTPAPSTTSSVVKNNSISSTLNQISIDRLGRSTGSLSFRVSNADKVKIYYGTAINKLNQVIEAFPLNGVVQIDLADLLPDTTYYLQIELYLNGKGTRLTDIYVFRTASQDSEAGVDPKSLVITSERLILLGPNDRNKRPTLMLSQGSSFEVQLALSKSIPTKRVHIEINRLKILGVNSDVSVNTNLIEIQPGVYFGQLKSLPEPGQYQVNIRTEDYNNSISDQSIFDLIVVPPISVKEAVSKSPIFGARVYVSKYNPTFKVYEEFPDSVFPNGNPGKTNTQGQWLVNLPQGKYRLAVSALGYESQTLDFEIKNTIDDRYPQIELLKTGFSLGNSITFYWQSLLDLADQLNKLDQELIPNKGVYQLFWAFILFSLIFATWLSLYHRTNLTWRHLLFWFDHHPTQQIIEGRVVDAGNQKPLGQVEVNFLDENDLLVATTTSLKSGKFLISKQESITKVLFQKVGYMTVQKSIDDNLAIELSQHEEKDFKAKLSHLVAFVFNSSYESLLILTLLIEIWLIRQFGFGLILPMIMITILNLMIWLVYRRSSRIS